MIGITTYSIDEILKVTGPLGVPDYGVTIASGETTLKTLQSTRTAAPGEDRKAFLAAFADVLIPTLASLRSDAWADLLGITGTLRDGRHILTWFRDPAEQALAARAGIDGAVRSQPRGLHLSCRLQCLPGKQAQCVDLQDVGYRRKNR